MGSRPVEVQYTLAGWGLTCFANGKAQESFKNSIETKWGTAFAVPSLHSQNVCSKCYDLLTSRLKPMRIIFGTARMKPWPYQTSRPAPLVRMAPVRVSNAFHEDGCLGVYLACPLDSLSLRCPVIADPVGIRPPDRVIAFFISSFDKQFATHLSPLIQM